MVADNLIEGSLKYRDSKKWKQRWGVLTKLSPVADVLQLQLYRDSRDRARGASTKASLALTNSLALITGFTLDKESHTLALLCQDVPLVLAFDSRDRLIQWNSKLNHNLGHEQQFLIQLVQVPLKSRIPVGPSKLHIRDHRFSITAGMPPRIIAAWASADVRRYGVIDGRFVWEGGTRCGRGAGVHVALSDTPHQITRTFDLASRGALTSSHRTIRTQGSCGTVQRDAATWLREVGALDLSKLSETASLAPSDACHLLSPQGTSRSDLSSAPWLTQRRPSCTGHDSYITGGSSSSSGRLVGDEPGWWASTWAQSGRGSLWEVAPSLASDSLYDSPKAFAHQMVSTASPSIVGIQHWCSSNTIRSTQPSVCSSAYHKPCVTTNPLDNYDVPRSRIQHYDTPRKFVVAGDSEKDAYGCVYPNRMDTCGRVMGWAEAFMCRRQDASFESSEPVRVNGEGRMPVLDANTGTIIQPGLGCHCEHGTLSRCQPLKPLLFAGEKPVQDITVSSNTAIYAVVDKSKKTSKPRCPTPTPTDDKTPTNPAANYANVSFPATTSSNIIDTDLQEKSILQPDSKISPEKEAESPAKHKEEVHYVHMGPAPTDEQSDYLCMKHVSQQSPTSPPRRHHYRPGRSLSLARRNRSPSPCHRRSTSADSRLNEPWDWSQYETPDPTPGGTPLPSPPQSPFKSSTNCSTISRGRGRTRKRPSDQCSTSSTNSSGSTLAKPPDVCPYESKPNDPPILRRSSSVPGHKCANRDSASSSDSGVCESPRPSDKVLLSHCYHNSLPRGHTRHKQCSTREVFEAKRRGEAGGDGKSSSSGNSDTSDYLDTLSLSSYSSSEYEKLFGRASVTTLRPRSGKEYSRFDRINLETSVSYFWLLIITSKYAGGVHYGVQQLQMFTGKPVVCIRS